MDTCREVEGFRPATFHLRGSPVPEIEGAGEVDHVAEPGESVHQELLREARESRRNVQQDSGWPVMPQAAHHAFVFQFHYISEQGLATLLLG